MLKIARRGVLFLPPTGPGNKLLALESVQLVVHNNIFSLEGPNLAPEILGEASGCVTPQVAAET